MCQLTQIIIIRFGLFREVRFQLCLESADSAGDQQDTLDTSSHLKEVHLLIWGWIGCLNTSLLSLELTQFSTDAIADQELQLAVLNDFDNDKRKQLISNICTLIYKIFQNMEFTGGKKEKVMLGL